MNLYDHLTQHYASDNGTVLVTNAQESWSFNRLEKYAAIAHQQLLALGVNKGDRVVVQVAKSPETIALYLCCIRSGFVFVPLNTAYTEEELKYFVSDAEPSVLVLDHDVQSGVDFGVRTVTLASLLQSKFAEPVADDQWSEILSAYRQANVADLQDLASIIYTSGTTGRPKGAALSQANLLANGQALSRLWGFSKNDVLLHALPVYHVHGLFIALHSALLAGAKVRFLPQFDVQEIIESLPACTVMMGVPTYYSRLLVELKNARARVAGVRLFVSGSAPLSVELFNAFYARTGHVILERYGMSETNIIASNPLGGERIAGTVGFALDGTRLRIADEKDIELPKCQTGAVQVQGDGVFDGYWRRPEVTRQEFTSDGYFRTGDLGQVDADGRLTLKGRSKDLIITGGLNVYPAEIERFLDALEGVAESAVVGVFDADFGERVEAFVVSDGQNAGLCAFLENQSRQGLANFKRPKAFHLIESLPRNTMGKVQKTVLRERLNPGK